MEAEETRLGGAGLGASWDGGLSLCGGAAGSPGLKPPGAGGRACGIWLGGGGRAFGIWLGGGGRAFGI